MKSYQEMTREELLAEKQELEAEFEQIKGQHLSLDMSRGKPSKEQLDLSMGLLDVLSSKDDITCEGGIDCRNYGVLEGIPEARRLMAGMFRCKPERVLIYGNSSLNIMYDQVARGMYNGYCGHKPWCYQGKIKFLCPVPGYDRHFAITEHFGIEMIPVPMHEDGPDMDIIEMQVQNNPFIKGIWCVPKYSNPQGITYSDDVVRRFAALEPAAPDFRIFWDNAYLVHDLYEDKREVLLDIFEEAKKLGHEDMIFEFCSTSKITFPGAGISAMATSKANQEDILEQMKIQTIGFDKIKQLRHARYFKDIDGIYAHMAKHADIIRPKFEMLEQLFAEEIGPRGIGTWINPLGGYFISFETMEGCAKDVVAKCKEAGVVLTPAGATFPYGKDPKDSVIRLAPTYPSMEELTAAAKVFVTVVRLVSVNKLLQEA